MKEIFANGTVETEKERIQPIPVNFYKVFLEIYKKPLFEMTATQKIKAIIEKYKELEILCDKEIARQTGEISKAAAVQRKGRLKCDFDKIRREILKEQQNEQQKEELEL